MTPMQMIQGVLGIIAVQQLSQKQFKTASGLVGAIALIQFLRSTGAIDNFQQKKQGD